MLLTPKQAAKNRAATMNHRAVVEAAEDEGQEQSRKSL